MFQMRLAAQTRLTSRFVQLFKHDLSTVSVASSSRIFGNHQSKRKNETNCLIVQPFRVQESSRTFGSLALFGLWGKSPEKTTTTPQGAAVDPPLQAGASPTQPPPVSDASPASSTPTDLSTGYIPEPPAILDENIILNALGEPTLQSLGLASNWPPGLIQSLLEWLHVTHGFEWFQSIIIFTIGLRLLLLPLNVLAQRSSIKMRKISPQMMHYQEKLSDAKMSGNMLEVAQATNDLVKFMKANDFSVLKMFVPMAQMPFMLSTFFAIRGMAKLPVESFQTGGALWFTDLTIADPYFLLPVLASASIITIIHRGVDTGVSAESMNPTTRLMFYAFGAISLPFFCFMPSGVAFYICASNFISLIYSIFFSFDGVKRALKIPILTEYDKLQIKESQKKNQNFLTGFKDKYQNMKVVAELKERESIQERMYKQAGTKVPQRTFKENPKLSAAIEAANKKLKEKK